MSLAAFIPPNTQKARSTTICAFKRMLEAENVSMDVVQACILGDNPSKSVAALRDRFGYYLATHEGKKGKLSRNSAISYFRNVKLWLFEEHPHLRQPSEADLLKKGKTLEKHCLKREKGGLVNKAPPCTKTDLRALIRHLYTTAAVAMDYEDAALACLMWHGFGRSSDLAFMNKQHITISADNVFYIRMLRVKTSEEQGLTLVPDQSDFLTCPIVTLAVALVMQEAPSASLLSQLPTLSPPASVDLDAGVPLLELLQSTSSPTSPSKAPTRATTPSPAPRSHPRGEDGVQAYVNRLLRRVAEASGVSSSLTSHSFRRGGAQHANGDERLAAQWIFDRGSWDMSKTNKGFAYVFNTPREDRKVARVLRGWRPDEVPELADIASLDYGAQECLERLGALLFSFCIGLKTETLNVSRKTIGVLTAYLIKNFPLVKDLAPESVLVARIDECLAVAQIEVADILTWFVVLDTVKSIPYADTKEVAESKTQSCGAGCHHIAVIHELIESNRQMAARLLLVENAILKRPRTEATEAQDAVQEASVQDPSTKRRKKATTNLSDTWFQWYTRVPRVWESSDRQKKPESRHVVAFMKLFIDTGFALLSVETKPGHF